MGNSLSPVFRRIALTAIALTMFAFQPASGTTDMERLYARIAEMERQELGKAFTTEPLADRIDRLEKKLFGAVQTGPPLQRLDALYLQAGAKVATASATGIAPSHSTNSSSDSGREYTDTRGKTVFFPLGDLSFATEVASFKMGVPSPTNSHFANPRLAIGPPNRSTNNAVDTKNPAEVSIGCGGVLVLHFGQVAIVDVPGPDLWVFEVGPSIEATFVDISTNGKDWVSVGRCAGATSGVDIAQVARPGARYHYVKLTDLKHDCRPPNPGADIDAVGAIGAVIEREVAGELLPVKELSGQVIPDKEVAGQVMTEKGMQAKELKLKE